MMHGEKLDRDATALFALKKYRSLKRMGGNPFYYHPRKVAKIAEMLVTKHFKMQATGGFLMPADIQVAEEAWHAGWLHDAMEKGDATFDDICHLTNIQVAQWVAGLTADTRLPGPRKVQNYVCQLAYQPDPVKIIKLAGLGNNLDDMVTLVRKKPTLSQHLIGHWPEEVVRTLEAIDRVRIVALGKEFRWCERAASALAHCVKKPQAAVQILEQLDDCPLKAPKKKRRRRRRGKS